jgi:3',5'-cyclic AMP phosphodiesterase CpdA
VTLHILHLADLHFGGPADVRQVEALERMIPDLRPDAVVVAGDLCQRTRHGELQRARAFANLAAVTAPVYVIPGNHDVAWWWRPLLPFGREALYRNYRRYFGDDLTPTLKIPGATIAGALTSHGVGFLSLTWRVRDLAVVGHLPKKEMERVTAVFREALPEDARVLVVHHNVLRGDLSHRMGLVRWRTAQRRIVESGADLVLCGHDHQEGVDVIPNSSVVVSTAGTMSTRSRAGRPGSFNFITVEPKAIQVTFFRWEGDRGRFRASDTFAFARSARHEVPQTSPVAANP